MPLSASIRSQLKQADKLPYNPRPRDLLRLRRAPKRALLVIVDGITPGAMKRAYTPTFDALNARGVYGTDARSIFPTITGPAHTSILTGARVGTHGFLYPKMLDAFGNRLLDFTEGLMQAETIAEAWRPRGITSTAIGSRFLRGADAFVSEGIVGEDLDDITHRAIGALRDWEPHMLMVVYYAADTLGHLFGPDAEETLAAIAEIDTRVSQILNAYDDKNFLDETVVVVVADHGMARVDEVVQADFVERVGAVPHGRLAFAARALSDAERRALLKDSRVDQIFSRSELELLGAWNPRWGKHVIHLKEGLMFPHSRKMVGYHGAWSHTEQHVPLFLSGAGIRAGGLLNTCEIVDLAPTLSVLLGGEIPRQADGRVLWEVLDTENALDAQHYLQLTRRRNELVAEFARLGKEFGADAMQAKEYSARRTKLKRIATQVIAEMKAESQRLCGLAK